MNPIVYRGDLSSADTSAYESLGLGALTDCISCHVVEERNGAYFLELEYPAGGANWDRLVPGNLIKVDVSGQSANMQLFRIDSAKPTLNRITVSARHISYQMDWAIVEPFTSSSSLSPAQAMAEIASHVKGAFPFSLVGWGDSTNAKRFSVKTPRTVRDCLMGKEGSITDVYGGEYMYRNMGFTIQSYPNRGTSRGVGIRYGLNMTSLEMEKALAETYNAVYGYYYDEDSGTFVSPGAVQTIGTYTNVGFQRTKLLDLTAEFDTVPTAAQLRAKALAYAQANGLTDPQVSIKVDFVPLRQTTDYETHQIEHFSLCDTIPVVYEKYGIEVTAKIVRTDYDILKERYRSIEVGTKRTTLSEFLKGVSGKTGVSVWT